MSIYSARRLKTELDEVEPDLPLGGLTFTADPSTNRATGTLNPNLPQMLARFAYFLDQDTTASGPFYVGTFDNWVKQFLTTTPTKDPTATSPDGRLGYQLASGLTNSSQVIQAMKTSLQSYGETSKYGYVGLYLFTVWFFLVETADDTVTNVPVFSNAVRKYVRARCEGWRWDTSGSRKIKIDPDFMDSAAFLRQFRVRSNSLNDMTSGQNLGDINALFEVDGIFSGAFQPINKRKANFYFIQFFRGLFPKFLEAEYRCLLREIDSAANENLKVFGLYAVGDGTDTTGYFGQFSEFGVAFFEYEGEPRLKFGPPYFVCKSERTVNIWQGTGGKPPDILIAQWGANWNGSSANIVIGGRESSSPLVVTDKNSAYFPNASDEDFLYLESSGVLTFRHDITEAVGLNLRSKALGANYDEISFFTLSYFPPPATPPTNGPDPELRIDHPFLDDEFRIQQSEAEAFWTNPAEQGAVDALILRMRDDPGFEIISSIVGRGVGQTIDGQPARLISAGNQTDNQIPNTVAVGNPDLRHAVGEVTWTGGADGRPGLLCLGTEGFCSALRCTWDSWPPFQAPTANPPFSGQKKIDEMMIDVGQHVRTSLGLGPSYNTTLSAFRAYSLMAAIVGKLQFRAEQLRSSELSDAQADAIILKLDTFLKTRTASILLQVGLDRDAGVTIDYQMFLKYAQ